MFGKNVKLRLLLTAIIITIVNSACAGGAEPPYVTTASVAHTVAETTETTAQTSGKSSGFNYRYDTSTAYIPTEPTETASSEESAAETTETTSDETTAATTEEQTTTTTTAATTTSTTTTSVAVITTTPAYTVTTTQTTVNTTPAQTNETTSTSENDDIIRTPAEFFDALAEASANLEQVINLNLANTELFNDFTNEEMNKLGIASAGMKSKNVQDYIKTEISLDYADYFRVSYAVANGKAAALTGTDKAIYQKATEVINNNISSSDSDFDKILKINNYLIDNVKYDYSFAKQSYTAYGALVGGKAVCQGYAYAFQLFMNILGIEGEVITGTGDNGTGVQSHGWNLVKLGGEYYHIDVTWNDSDDETLRSHVYFNVNDKNLSADHTWNRDFYPASGGTKYNYYKYMGLEKASLSDLESSIADGIADGQDSFEYYCTFPVNGSDLEFVHDYIGQDGFRYMTTPYGNGVVVHVFL